MKHTILTLALALVAITQNKAQNSRFSGHYPLATPQSSAEKKVEYDKTLTAVAGGIIMMETAPNNREDPEALSKQDYQTALDEMLLYALELEAELGNNAAESLKKAAKAIKSSKYEDALSSLKDGGATAIGQGSEEVFFIWKSYLTDKKNSAPWLEPDNIEVSKKYRAILYYVSKNYDRPFGAQAEIGAVVADAAQALSNSLENPQELSWLGEGELTFKQQDEMRRLASNVSYFEWRLNDVKAAPRSALIPLETVLHVKRAFFDMVRTILADKKDWSKDEAHGANLQQLYHDVQSYGWTVDGERAKKGNGTPSTTVSNHSSDTKPEKTPKEKGAKEPKEKKEKVEKEPKEKKEKEPKEKKEKDEEEEDEDEDEKPKKKNKEDE